jgi:CspA family cold shock protein
MPTGKVKWFDSKKGYGFIIGEEGQDVFVHYSSIAGQGFRALKDGEFVSYELIKGEKGHQARNVSRQKPAVEGQPLAPEAPAPPAPA